MATAGVVGAVSQPQPAGTSGIVNFTDTQAAFGFGGRFDTGISSAGSRKWYKNSSWAGYIRGTQCRMPCSGGGDFPYRVSVDGGAEFDCNRNFTTTNMGVLFTALADTWHFVTIKVNSEGGYDGGNNNTNYTGVFLEVTGIRPLLSNQADMGITFNLNDPAFLGKHTFCKGTIEDTFVRPQYVRNDRTGGDQAGGCVMVSAKCESLWLLCSTRNFWVSIDNAAPYKVDFIALSSIQPRWTKVLSGLDINNFHNYLIIPNDNDQTVTPESIMLGGNGAAIQALPITTKRVLMLGDSITWGRNSALVLQGSTDLYKICAFYKFVGSAAGIPGRNAPGLDTAMAAILAAQNAPSDYALITIGVNDSITDATTRATFKTAMISIVNKCIAAGILKVAIRRIYQAGTGEVANSTDPKNVVINEVIAGFANPNIITYGDSTLNIINTNGQTLDGLHPNEVGYSTIANLEITFLTAFFS